MTIQLEMQSDLVSSLFSDRAIREARLKIPGLSLIHGHQLGCSSTARGPLWPAHYSCSSLSRSTGLKLISYLRRWTSSLRSLILSLRRRRAPRRWSKGSVRKGMEKHGTKSISHPRGIRPWWFCSFYLFTCLVIYMFLSAGTHLRNDQIVSLLRHLCLPPVTLANVRTATSKLGRTDVMLYKGTGTLCQSRPSKWRRLSVIITRVGRTL